MKEINKNTASHKITRLSFLNSLLSLLMAGPLVFLANCKKKKSVKIPPASYNPSLNFPKVCMVKNGDCFQNISKLFELMGGISKYIDPTDVVIIKGNAQWPYQGYTHTGCIKAVIDEVLMIPGFSGEILICDNIQNTASDNQRAFLAASAYRTHNWPDHNWSSLAAEYQSNGIKVAVKQWTNSPADVDITDPADGEGWVRDFFYFHGFIAYLSYPIFQSPLTPGRMIDMKYGVWENGEYTGRKAKTIFMPTLNNHGNGSEDYAGVTSAIKCFFGATEIHYGDDSTLKHGGQTCYHMHSASYSRNNAKYAGELAARYINTMYSPVLYITAAMWSGHHSRTGAAMETNTVLACENPATLDYVSCKYVISPYASFLDPDQNNNTRRQIVGCINAGIGTIDENEFEVISYEF